MYRYFRTRIIIFNNKFYNEPTIQRLDSINKKKYDRKMNFFIWQCETNAEILAQFSCATCIFWNQSTENSSHEFCSSRGKNSLRFHSMDNDNNVLSIWVTFHSIREKIFTFWLLRNDILFKSYSSVPNLID